MDSYWCKDTENPKIKNMIGKITTSCTLGSKQSIWLLHQLSTPRWACEDFDVGFVYVSRNQIEVGLDNNNKNKKNDLSSDTNPEFGNMP